MEYKPIVTLAESEKSTIQLARMPGYTNPVVIKILRESAPEIYRQLLGEKNPYLPQIYEVEEAEDELLIAEEYLDGDTLEEYLKGKQISDANKLQIALQLCEAVGFLHTLKPPVIHRDIKPANILITGKGMVKLIDFDASRQYKETRGGSDTRLLGTVEYAPPEQFGYSQTDVRSDIYSMGVVFHDMQLKGNRRLKVSWEKIVKRCTNFDPKHRYQSVSELKKEIEKLILRKKAAIWKTAMWSCMVLAFVVAAAPAVLHWSKQEAVGNVSMITGTPEPTLSPTSNIVPTPTPEPTLSPTSTIVPTPTPEPTLSPTVTVVPTPTPEPTLSPTSNIVPTPTPEPTLSPTATVVPTLTPIPTMTEQMRIFAQNMETPAKVSASNYNFYKGEAENTELIYVNDVAGKEITFLGGMCYKFETEEFLYVPSEMLDGGPTYYRVADEYLMGLEPGLYFFYISRENETGRKSHMGRSVEIHSEEKSMPQREDFLIDTTREFYSDYQRDADFVVWCDVRSRIDGLYIGEESAKKNPVDSSCYDITCDGKVLLIKKEYLSEIFSAGDVTFTITFDNGQSQKGKVNMVRGLPDRVSPTPMPTSTVVPTPIPEPTLSPTPTVVPTPTLFPSPTITAPASAQKIPETLKYHYYKGLSEKTELILQYGGFVPMVDAVPDWVECYNYLTNETIDVPLDMVELGVDYIWIAREFVQTLEPSIYKFTTRFYYNNKKNTRQFSQSVEIHSKEEEAEQVKSPFVKGGINVYLGYPKNISYIILCNSTCQITGIALSRAGGSIESIDAKWYDILYNGKTLEIKKEYLMQYCEEGKITLVCTLSDGRQQNVTVTFREGLPEGVDLEKLGLASIPTE